MAVYTVPLRTRSPTVSDDDSCERFIAVGIDFGTTYSGVCWARSSNPQDIKHIEGWPSSDPQTEQETQVRTEYDILSGKWGYEITPDQKPVKWFKLLLLKDEDILKDVRESPQLKEARSLLDKHTDKQKPVELVGAYLKKLWDFTYATLKTMMDIDDMRLRVAITVPAIWPEYARSLMREAAEIAGITNERDIGETTLILVAEPEAAALATLFEHNSYLIKKDESFVVCDAGGGTVDVISYTVESEKPFKLNECVVGAGNLTGAFQIDESFKTHLQGTAKKIELLSNLEYNQFFYREWEQGAKRSFSNAEEPKFFHLRMPSKALGRMNRLRNRESLEINREEMKGFFNKSYTGIRKLISSQYDQVEKKTGKPPKKILLVGGLGSSRYIYNALNMQWENRVFRPSSNWSAVARGATICLLQENISSQNTLSPKQRKALHALPSVISRKSRYHYGIVVKVPVDDINPEDGDQSFKDPEGVKRVNRMKWYLNKGEKVDETSHTRVPYHKLMRAPLPPRCTFKIMYSSEDVAPKRPSPEVSELCIIECDWDKPFEKWKPVGNPSLGWRKHDDLELTMGLKGEPIWMIRVGSKSVEHDFEVKYM